MTQDEIIEMARQVGYDDIEQSGIYKFEDFDVEAFTKLVEEKAFEEGFYAGFKASGEGWNGECPFNDLGLDIQQDESVQHELKEAIKARGQA
jgi:hypothetical protein